MTRFRWVVMAIALVLAACSEDSSEEFSAPIEIGDEFVRLDDGFARYERRHRLLTEGSLPVELERSRCPDDADCVASWRILEADYRGYDVADPTLELGEVVAESGEVTLRVIRGADPAIYLAGEIDGETTLFLADVPYLATSRSKAQVLRNARCSLAVSAPVYVGHQLTCESPVVRWLPRVGEVRSGVNDPLHLSDLRVTRVEPTAEEVARIVDGRLAGHSFGALRGEERLGPFGSAVAATAEATSSCGGCLVRTVEAGEGWALIETFAQPGLSTGTGPNGETHYGLIRIELFAEAGWWISETGPSVIHTNTSADDAERRRADFEAIEPVGFHRGQPPAPTTTTEPAALPEGVLAWQRPPERATESMDSLTSGTLRVESEICVVLTRNILGVTESLPVQMPPRTVITPDGTIVVGDLEIGPDDVVFIDGGEAPNSRDGMCALSDKIWIAGDVTLTEPRSAQSPRW